MKYPIAAALKACTTSSVSASALSWRLGAISSPDSAANDDPIIQANLRRRLAAGQTVGPEASADKLLLGACEQSVYDAARSLLGPGFLFGDASRQWREEWWYSRTTTVYGGSAEVQRGIIADRVLKLPKD